MKVIVEFLGYSRVTAHEFGRIPVKGDYMELDDKAWMVTSVTHIVDAGQGQPVAHVRVVGRLA